MSSPPSVCARSTSFSSGVCCLFFFFLYKMFYSSNQKKIYILPDDPWNLCNTKSDQVQEPPSFDIPSKCWVKLSANKHVHRKSVVGYEPFFNPKKKSQKKGVCDKIWSDSTFCCIWNAFQAQTWQEFVWCLKKCPVSSSRDRKLCLKKRASKKPDQINHRSSFL